jgi:hypothetical protein
LDVIPCLESEVYGRHADIQSSGPTEATAMSSQEYQLPLSLSDLHRWIHHLFFFRSAFTWSMYQSEDQISQYCSHTRQQSETMPPEKAIQADHPMQPNVNQTAAPTKGHGMRATLEAPLIGLAMYLVGVALGLHEQFASGVLITTIFISAARLMTSGFSQKEMIAGSASLGLFAQLVCYHFEMNPIMRIGNALSTSFSIYLAWRSSSSTTESSAGRSHAISESALDSAAIESTDLSENKRTSIWLVFAGLVFVATFAGYLFANQISTNTCTISTSKIDSTHWQAVVRGGDLSGKGCDVPAQMSLAADEMRAYTRDLREDFCSVSCVKQNHAGYWTAYVSITPPGGPVDRTHCGEAYSHGNCGQGLTRQRTA